MRRAGATLRRRLRGADIFLVGLILVMAAVPFVWDSTWLQFFLVFVPLAVVIHEFAHAFQAQAGGQRVLDPAVAYLPLRFTAAIGLGMMALAVWVVRHSPVALVWMTLAALVAASGGLLWVWHPRALERLRIRIPVGIGMHIEHTHRSWADVIVGPMLEAGFWLLIGAFVAPIWLLVAPLTLVINLVPIKIGGEANDGLSLLREQRARRRGGGGRTQV